MTSFFLPEWTIQTIFIRVLPRAVQIKVWTVLNRTSDLRREVEQKQAAFLEIFLIYLTPGYAQAHSSEKMQLFKLCLSKPSWLTATEPDFIFNATPSWVRSTKMQNDNV